MDEIYQGITISIKPDSPRAGIFTEIFGRLHGIPVVYGAPHEVVNVDTAEMQQVYALNISRLSASELTRLVSHYAARLNVIPDRMRGAILQQGILIAADDCVLEGAQHG